MANLGWSFTTSWEVALYSMLLLGLWLLMRVLAMSMTVILKYFGESPLKVDPYLNGVKYPVSYWTERGGRPYQEDRYNIIKAKNFPEASIFGVFDGHGGYRAAQFCKENLLQTIAQDIEKEADPSKALSRSFMSVDIKFSEQAKVQKLNDGTTAVVAIVDAEKIFVGNAGDSRAILIQRGGKVRPLSLDHRPERKDEEHRIKRLGGKLIYWGRWRVEGVLAVSRAIGDVALQPFITSEPEVVEKRIESDDEYLVLASDGLWDVMENEEVARLVLSNSQDFLTLGKKLCSEAIVLGSTDNVTALVIDLKKRYQLHSENNFETKIST